MCWIRSATPSGRDAGACVFATPGSVAGLEVVPGSSLGEDFGDRQRSKPSERLGVEHRTRHLASRNQPLHQHVLVVPESLTKRSANGTGVTHVSHQRHTDCRALGRWLDGNAGRELLAKRTNGAVEVITSMHDDLGRDGELVGAEGMLCSDLVAGQSASEHTRADVGEAEHLEQTLQASVFTESAVGDGECDVIGTIEQGSCEGGLELEAIDVMSGFAQGSGDTGSGGA